MSKYDCTLPSDFVKSHFAELEKVGIKPTEAVVESLLYEMGRAGIENHNAMRYCKFGDKKGFEVYKTIEEIGTGTLWETQCRVNKELYIFGCHYK